MVTRVGQTDDRWTDRRAAGAGHDNTVGPEWAEGKSHVITKYIGSDVESKFQIFSHLSIIELAFIEPMLEYCSLVQTSGTFVSKYESFHSTKCIELFCLQNVAILFRLVYILNCIIRVNSSWPCEAMWPYGSWPTFGSGNDNFAGSNELRMIYMSLLSMEAPHLLSPLPKIISGRCTGYCADNSTDHEGVGETHLAKARAHTKVKVIGIFQLKVVECPKCHLQSKG